MATFSNGRLISGMTRMWARRSTAVRGLTGEILFRELFEEDATWLAFDGLGLARMKWDTRENASGLGLRVAVDLDLSVLDPAIADSGVVNLASQAAGNIAPGELISIRGQFGISESASLTVDDDGLASTALLGVRVLFDDIPAPLLLVTANEIQAVAPYELADRDLTWLSVELAGQTSLPSRLKVAQASPGIFTLDSTGKGLAAALLPNGVLNGSSNPVRAGGIVTLFGTGAGQTSPPSVTGKVLTGAPYPSLVQDIACWIGDAPATVEFAGGVPGEIAGLLQIAVRVPQGLPPERAEVVLRIGEERNQPAVFIFVR
jgi:trimeric autotransporter adhesin